MTQEELNLLYQELDNYFSGFKGLETSNWNWRTDSLNVHGNGIVDFAKHFVEWQKRQTIEKAYAFLYRKLANGKVLHSRLIDDMREYLEQ